METARIFLAIICFAFIERGIVPDSRDLSNEEKLLAIASAELGVREKTGKNDGHRVEEYLKTVGLRKGEPYCAAYISWVFKQAGYPAPRTGWSPSLFPKKLLVTGPSPAVVFGIYFPDLKRVGHCGFVKRVKGDWIISLEANTNIAGSREGEGVHSRLRHIKTIHSYANWLKKKGEKL